MQINLIAIGKRMPTWIATGFEEYRKRMPAHCQLRLIEIPLIPRTKNANISNLVHKEGEQMLATIPSNNNVIALDMRGQLWNTLQLATQLQQWIETGRDTSILIGGPDGLAPHCLRVATMQWSLSPLTLPHPLVRVIVAEQLYRAWSILSKHPYHR